MAPKKKDAVHRYFQYDETSNANTCLLCKNKLKGKHTTNLKAHLATKHINEYKIVADLNKNTAGNKNTTSNESTIIQIEKLKKLCMQLVTVHGRPLAMMEDEAFQNILNIAAATDVACKNINIKAIKTKILQEAREIKRKISVDVRNQMISLKLDSATCQERKFVGVNIQYIKNTKIIVRNLAVLEVNERQTSTFLKNVLQEILTDFMISSDQIYCICTDNGSNMVKMVKLMGGKYISEDFYPNNEPQEENTDEDNDSEEENVDQENEADLVFNNMDFDIGNFIDNDRTFKIRGMLCAAHTLQLAVKDAINSDVAAQSTISKAKMVVNILRKPNNANSLRKANLKKAIKDCATRWTSTYNMMVRLVSLKDFSDTIPEITSLVSEEFWGEVKDLLNCLQPSNEATIKLQKEQLTMGDFYITWLSCKNSIAVIEHSFALALHASMEQREVKLLQNDAVLEALYLDGRLNVVLSVEQCQKARTLLIEVFNQINCLQERDITHQSDLFDSDAESIQIINSVEDPIPGITQNLTAVEQLLQNSERARGNVRQHRSFDICLYELCATPRLSLNQNIIMHWHNKAVAFSELAKVSMVVFGAPATQVSVERLFSSLKFILHPLRTNISPSFLKDLMLVRANKDLL